MASPRVRRPPGPKIGVLDLARELEKLPDERFTSDEVTDFLMHHPVEPSSLEPFRLFRTERYTRNLVSGNDRFEVILICWPEGVSTPIHNHEGQSCWVYVLSGKLAFTTYKWLGCERDKRVMHLELASHIPVAAEGSLNVIDERDAIHRLSNEASFSDRALSLHVYAKPLTTCAIYDVNTGSCWDQTLKYDSISGRPVVGFSQ